MSHQAQQDFIAAVKNAAPQAFENKKVIEVGSLNINGTVRDFFTDCDYTGIDLGFGEGVDLVLDGSELTSFYPLDFFDVAISTECFEHNPKWRETFWNMYNVSRDIVIFTCAGLGRPEHGTARTDSGSSPYTAQSNYYRNLEPEDFIKDFTEHDFSKFIFIENNDDHDLYFVGVKGDLECNINAIAEYGESLNDFNIIADYSTFTWMDKA